MGLLGQPHDPPMPKLTPERKTWLDDQVFIFLNEKNLLDCDIIRMPSARFSDLRMWFAVHAIKHGDEAGMTLEILAEYLGYTEVNVLYKAIKRVTGLTTRKIREDL